MSELNKKPVLRRYKHVTEFEIKAVSAVFQTGVDNLELGNTLEAEKCFKLVRKSESRYHRRQAIWYLGLTYLKAYRVEEAIEILKKITPDFENYEEVQKILDALIRLDW